MTNERIADHFCGQTQPHGAHAWETPQIYGQATLIAAYQCAGLSAYAPRITYEVDQILGGLGESA